MGLSIRHSAGSLLRRLLRATPPSLLGPLAGRLPARLRRFVPPGKEILFTRYLGSLHVRIDTAYAIEREMLRGQYDPATVAVIERLVQPGHVCVDVGANVGAITLALAQRVGPGGQVLAFEPGVLPYRRLLANLALNPHLKERARPLKLGLSNHCGTLYWVEDAANPGNAGLRGLPQLGDEAVPVVLLDTYLRDHPLPRLDFVKIDVEGLEEEVIQGGMATWAQYRPALYYETLLQFEAARSLNVLVRIESYLGSLGYKFFKVGRRGELTPTRYPDLSANTLALHPARLV